METVTTETAARTGESPRPLAHNANFALLLSGQFVSQLGDRLAMVAFPWLVWRSSHSYLSTGVMLAVYTLPYLVFGLFAGVIVDRFDRRRLMILTDVARAFLVALVPAVATRSFAGTLVLSFATASLGVFFDPAKMSLLPDVVDDVSLVRANSLLETAEKLTEMLGYAAAGIMLTVISTTSAFRLDALTFAVSAMALALMKTPLRRRAAAKARHVGRELGEGLAFLRRHRGLLANTVLVVFSAAGLGATYPLTFFLAVPVFHKGPAGFSGLEVAIAAGYFVGAIVVAALGSKLRLGVGIIGGLISMGVFLALVATTDSIWASAVPLAAVGFANAFALIAIDTYVQRTVPEELRGRVWGARLCLTQGAWALGIILTAVLARELSVETLLVGVGLVIAVPAVVGAFVPAARDI